MSINKDLRFSDYKEVILQPDQVGNKILLSDLVNSAASQNDKVIASIFLIGKYKTSDPKYFLILKPKCLWLKLTNTNTLVDANNSESIAVFKPYTASEIIKASFLSTSQTVLSILTSQGVANESSVYGLSKVFLYDLNELNRTRSAAISPVGNSNLNNIWL